MITLRAKDGITEKAEIRQFSYSGTFMGECYLTATIETPTPINFEIGDYCLYRGERFELNYIPAKEKQASAGSYGSAFKYDNIKFNSLADELTRVEFLDIVQPDNGIHYTSKPDFDFYAASVQDLADRIQANLDAEYTGSKKWTVTVLPELVTPDKTISVSGITVWDAVALANTEFKANFIIRNRTITIGTAGYAVGAVFGYGKGKGLYDIQQVTNQDAKIITRLRAYGSTRNMPYKYYNTLKYGSGNSYIAESLYMPNLMLPDFPYVQNDPKEVYLQSASFTEYGTRYGHVYFDDSNEDEVEIYPSIEGMTAEQLADAGIIVSLPSGDNGIINEVLGADNPTDDGIMPEEGSGITIDAQFTFYLKDLGFDLSEKDSDGKYKYATTDTMQISMKSGMCVGRTFDVVDYGITKDTSLGYIRFKVECNRFSDESVNMAYPNANWKIEAGDKFVILGIAMPEVYIKAASQKLLTYAQEYLAQNDSTKYTYTPKIDELFMANHPDLGESIKEGDIFNFTDTDLDIDASVIIQSLTIKEGDKLIPTYEVTLSNDRIAGTIEKMQNAIGSLQSNASSISLDQVKSMVSSIGTRYFLSKTTDDTANGNINFMQSVSVVQDLTVNRNIKSDGKVTSNQFGNDTFSSGQFGSGFRTWLADNGQSYAEFDNLLIRREMLVYILTIAEIKSVGGSLLLSLANMTASAVADGGTYWKVSFDSGDGTIPNQFAVDDQVICRKFNGANIKYYWAKVTSIGSDYINISKSDKDGSGIPAIGDEIIQFGNRTNTSRQAAILMSTYGVDAPSFKQYAGINSYDLTGKEVTVISPSGNKFTGDFIIKSTGKSVDQTISDSITSIQIGGTNLLRNSSFVDASYWGRIGDHSLSVESGDKPVSSNNNSLKINTTTGSTGSGNYIYQDYSPQLEIGKEYTLSFWAKSVTGVSSIGTQIHGSNGATSYSVTSDWKYFTFTFKYNTFTTNRFLMYLNQPGTILINSIQLEEGNKASAWSENAQDVQARIDAAQTAASNADAKAQQAQTDASTADAKAVTANSLLADIASDDKLVPSEKQDTQLEWDAIKSEYTKNVTQATNFSVSYTAYQTAYNSLNSYITPLLSSLTTTSNIIGTTFRSTFKSYYDARTDLLNAIAAKVKTLADTAQSKADEAIQRVSVTESSLTVLNDKIESKVAQSDFNTLQGRVSTAESNITQNATQISQTITKVDAKSTAYKSTSASDYPKVPYSKGDIWITYDGVIMQANASRLSGSFILSEWTASTKYIGQDAVDSSVSSIQIGGSNLLRNTRLNVGKNNATDNDYLGLTSVYGVRPSSGVIDPLTYGTIESIKPDTYYTLSFYIKGENNTDLVTTYLYPSAIATGINSQGATTSASDGGINFKVSTEWQRVWVTYKTLSSTTGAKSVITHRMHAAQGVVGKKVWVCGVKLEEGNKPTSYTEAPADVQAGIDAAQTAADTKNRVYYQDATPTAPSGGFKTGDIWFRQSLVDYDGNINSDTAKNKFQLQYRWNGSTWIMINWSASRTWVSQTDSSITSVVEKTGINGLGTGETLKSLIDQTPEQINIAVSSIEIGSRNYVRNSKSITKSATSSQANFFTLQLSESLQSDTQYTLSIKRTVINSGDNSNVFRATVYSSGAVTSQFFNLPISDTLQTVSFKTISGLASDATLLLYTGYPGNSANRSFTWDEVKLEKSTKRSDWTPAPEDAQEGIATAQAAATAADAKAKQAQTDANTAISNYNSIVSDGILDPSEKQATKREWTAVQAEYAKNYAQAVSYGVSISAYQTAYNSLNSYITPLLASMTTNSNIVATTYINTWTAYYNANVDLLNAITTKAKDTAVNEVKAGITVTSDTVTVFGQQMKVDSDLMANAIQTNKLQVGTKFEVGTDGKIKAVDGEFSGTVSSNNDSGDKILIDPVRRAIILKDKDGHENTYWGFANTGDVYSQIRFERTTGIGEILRSLLDTSGLALESDANKAYLSRAGLQFIRSSNNSQFKITMPVGDTLKLGINIKNLPTSNANLSTGDLWRDGELIKIKI